MNKKPKEMEFCDLRTLAYMYDSTKSDIQNTVTKLVGLGYGIDVLEWGERNKIKVNQKQLRSALMKEFLVKIGGKA